jgi:hypothetical protein
LGGPEHDVEEGVVAAAVSAEERGRARGEVGEDGGTIKVEIDDRGLPDPDSIPRDDWRNCLPWWKSVCPAVCKTVALRDDGSNPTPAAI